MTYDKEAIADLLEQVAQEGDPKLYTSLEEGLAAIPALPPAWEPLRRASEGRRETLNALWSEVGGTLPKTLKMLERKVAGFAILTTAARQPSLLYLLGKGRDLLAQRGFWPTSKLPAVAKKLPIDLLPFYQLHDGWVSVFGGEDGPLPSGEWRIIGQAPDIKGFLQIYANGAQGVGFDLDGTPPTPVAIDADEPDVEELEDFWSDLDDRLSATMRSLPEVVSGM
jgi:hypothetical protein